MKEDEVFRIVQKYMSSIPVVLMGTGATIPYGMSGMYGLSKYLIKHLNRKYKGDRTWCIIRSKLSKGVDLESALTGLVIEDELMQDFTNRTWELLTNDDIEVFNKLLISKQLMPLSQLIMKLYNPTPRCVNIITTNYDRLIEYACDQAAIPCNNLFQGEYIKFPSSTLKYREMVNVLKVHGSLDWFKNIYDMVYSIPLQQKIPKGFDPQIIAPGSTKYKKVLQEPFREVLHNADNVIGKANSYLCVGFGFNDEQIQAKIIEGIRKGKPIIVVTKSISDKAKKLIRDNSSHYIIIQQNEPTLKEETQVIIPTEEVVLDKNYWTLEGFLEMF